MKQYTNQDQTSKLIELGFPRPRHSSSVEEFNGKGWAGHIRVTFDYSIGELINLLPRRVCHEGLEIVFDGEMWMVMYGHQPFSDYSRAPELVDALFYFCASWKNGKDMEEYKKYI